MGSPSQLYSRQSLQNHRALEGRPHMWIDQISPSLIMVWTLQVNRVSSLTVKEEAQRLTFDHL